MKSLFCREMVIFTIFLSMIFLGCAAKNASIPTDDKSFSVRFEATGEESYHWWIDGIKGIATGSYQLQENEKSELEIKFDLDFQFDPQYVEQWCEKNEKYQADPREYAQGFGMVIEKKLLEKANKIASLEMGSPVSWTSYSPEYTRGEWVVKYDHPLLCRATALSDKGLFIEAAVYYNTYGAETASPYWIAVASEKLIYAAEKTGEKGLYQTALKLLMNSGEAKDGGLFALYYGVALINLGLPDGQEVLNKIKVLPGSEDEPENQLRRKYLSWY